MTDERMGATLWRVLDRLPRGSGVVFRHHGTQGAARRLLRARILAVVRRRGLVLIDAGPRGRGADGVHGRRGAGLVTWPAHDRREAIRGLRAGAAVLFVSPVFATRSHPGARPLGRWRAAAIAAGLPAKAVALGGMDAGRFRRLAPIGFHGWAAIDAWAGAGTVRGAGAGTR